MEPRRKVIAREPGCRGLAVPAAAPRHHRRGRTAAAADNDQRTSVRPGGAAALTSDPGAASPSRARASARAPGAAKTAGDVAIRHRVPGRPGAGRDARPAPPARRRPESMCPEGCRETAGTTADASPLQRRSDRRPRAGQQRCPAPAAVVPGCGCVASDPGDWWHSRGAAPGRAHRARPAVATRAAPGPPGSCAAIQVAAAGPSARLATTPSVQAFPPSAHRRDRRHPGSRAPASHRSDQTRRVAPATSPEDRPGGRSAAASG